MKTFRFLIVLLAIAVGFAGLNADAKVKELEKAEAKAKAPAKKAPAKKPAEKPAE